MIKHAQVLKECGHGVFNDVAMNECNACNKHHTASKSIKKQQYMCLTSFLWHSRHWCLPSTWLRHSHGLFSTLLLTASVRNFTINKPQRPGVSWTCAGKVDRPFSSMFHHFPHCNKLYINHEHILQYACYTQTAQKVQALAWPWPFPFWIANWLTPQVVETVASLWWPLVSIHHTHPAHPGAVSNVETELFRKGSWWQRSSGATDAFVPQQKSHNNTKGSIAQIRHNIA